MSTAQQIIEKNFEQLCKDVIGHLDDSSNFEERVELYRAIRAFTYEFLYDSSTVDDAGDAKYIANKYDDDYYYNGTTLDS